MPDLTPAPTPVIRNFDNLAERRSESSDFEIRTFFGNRISVFGFVRQLLFIHCKRLNPNA